MTDNQPASTDQTLSESSESLRFMLPLTKQMNYL